MFLSFAVTHAVSIGILNVDPCLSRRDPARMSAARLTCRVCVPVRSFCYLGGPVRVHGRSFFKRVFSSACTRRARALFFIMSGYPSSSLLVVFSVGAGERKRDREIGRVKENERKKETKRDKAFVRILSKPTTRFPTRGDFIAPVVVVLKSDGNNIIRYTRHSLSS